jgi:type IV pilus assembly protein PilE
MKHIQTGFTLIELMITVAIIGILAAVAMPSYSEYVLRGRIVENVASLTDMRVKMEQFFQDNRTYVGACAANTVAPLPAATAHFTFTCPTLTASAFTVTATGTAQMAGFVYTIDQANVRTTTGLPSGWTGTNSTCWVLKKGGAC